MDKHEAVNRSTGLNHEVHHDYVIKMGMNFKPCTVSLPPQKFARQAISIINGMELETVKWVTLSGMTFMLNFMKIC